VRLEGTVVDEERLFLIGAPVDVGEQFLSDRD
jgi:hypothetical protein